MGSRAHTFLLQLQVDWNIVLRKITIAHPLGEIVRADHLLASFLEARLRALSGLVAALQEKNANGLKRGECGPFPKHSNPLLRLPACFKDGSIRLS